jgi:hypothetical protein
MNGSIHELPSDDHDYELLTNKLTLGTDSPLTSLLSPYTVVNDGAVGEIPSTTGVGVGTIS